MVCHLWCASYMFRPLKAIVIWEVLCEGTQRQQSLSNLLRLYSFVYDLPYDDI